MSGNTQQRGVVSVGVDDTTEALNAARYALDLARVRKSDLRLVHAYGYPFAYTPYGRLDQVRMQRSAHAVIDTVAAELNAPDQIRVDRRTENSATADALIRASADSTLTVVGHRAKTWGERRLLGSIASRLAAKAFSPVVVLPGASHDPASPEAPVVVAVGATDSAHGTLEFAFDHAMMTHRPVLALHATTGADDVGRVRELASVSEALAVWRRRYPDVVVRLHDVEGGPGAALADLAPSAAILVVGRPHQSAAPGAWLRSAGRSVLRQTTCPLAIIPPDFAYTGPESRGGSSTALFTD